MQLYRLLLAIVLTATVAVGETPPKEWVDPATGHRVIRLSDESGTASLYFHQNPYTASGDKMVVTTREGLAAIDLHTRKIEPLVAGRVSQVVVGKKTRQVFYMRDGTVYATHLDTHTTRAIVKRSELSSGSGLAINADETMLAGSFVEPNPTPGPPLPRGASLEERWEARQPMSLYT